MPKFTDALRGYAFQVHKRDKFKCQYCGADGAKSFETWLTLSLDHLLPKGHPQRDDPEYMTTACQFCNTADNQYFRLAKRRGLKFDGLTRAELIEQRQQFVENTRRAYREFWVSQVQPN